MDSVALADFDHCAEAVRRICRPYRLAATTAGTFRGSVRNFTAAALNITELRLGPSRMSQDPEGPAGSGAPYLSLVVQLQGAARVRHHGEEACLGPGDLVLLDSGARTLVEVSHGSGQLAWNIFQPADLARLTALRAACGRTVGCNTGPAAVLRDALLSIVRHAGGLGSLDLRRHAIDLLLATFGHPAMEAAGIDAIVRYIDTRLHLSSLDPQQVAARFGLSLRQLYRVTAAHDTTPGALIWERRLQRARSLLAAGAPGSITQIAHQCGFKDSAHFARAYRRTFGEPPSASRSH